MEEQVTEKRWKWLIILGTFLLLLIFEFAAIIFLLKIGFDIEENEVRKPWLLGVTGGFLGGTTRGIYAFVSKIHCRAKYHGRLNEKEVKEQKKKDKKCKDEDIEFDPITVWYLFLLKPFIGLGVGFLFALLVKFGLIPFLISNSESNNEAFGIVLAAGLAGIFAEDAMHKLQSVFSGK